MIGKEKIRKKRMEGMREGKKEISNDALLILVNK